MGDLLVFILDHFQAEEKAMRDSLLYMVDRHVWGHMEDHAQISLQNSADCCGDRTFEKILTVRT
ncbi:MAG: hypothetical protein IPJ38_00835 [Dechloromonas sp.]|uniref:Uncharacterized protein n=1 Tax=Candidatus Dechloromonas phosphorivorans TaxID=2899244 RepID=A0A935K161_9RHOO|nr:hypothetical protein [Candidatus Dechloromonas phosphorivorans]